MVGGGGGGWVGGGGGGGPYNPIMRIIICWGLSWGPPI